MANVRPFRGLLFNPQVVRDLSSVICPPYDVISPQLQKELYRQSLHNVVRLEEGEVHPSDTPSNNRYTRAADTLQQWMRDRILVRDMDPAYYLVRHGFPSDGGSRVRLGLLAAVGLVEYERGVVLPHEYTQRAAKEDRLALMEACRANLSHVMLLYRDEEKRMPDLFRQVMEDAPTFSFSDSKENTYALWHITDPSHTGLIRQAMSSKALYIADGHHRYETALAYRDSQADAGEGGDAGHNFIMAYLVEFEDPGLVVLPYHRVVGGLDSDTLARLWDQMDRVFVPGPFAAGPQVSPEGFLTEIQTRVGSELVLGVVRSGNERANLLTIRPEAVPRERGPIASFEAWTLEETVLKPVLRDSLDRHVTWTHDAHEAIGRLQDGWHQAAFLLKPLPMDLFEAIVSQGERLPRKSTFFYPKLPTGLVINPLEGEL